MDTDRRAAFGSHALGGARVVDVMVGDDRVAHRGDVPDLFEVAP
jgi:hypothetical protein